MFWNLTFSTNVAGGVRGASVGRSAQWWRTRYPSEMCATGQGTHSLRAGDLGAWRRFSVVRELFARKGEFFRVETEA